MGYIRIVVNNTARLSGGDCDEHGFEFIDSYDYTPSSEGDKAIPKRRAKFSFTLNGLELSYFSHLLLTSDTYRQHVINRVCNQLKDIAHVYSVRQLSFHLVNPPYQIIDKMWNDRIVRLVVERSELDNAMSWLSTLGGAYSALGDHFAHCAYMAGRISIQQFRIALRLGDESTVARCKLYAALSLIQTRNFKAARRLIEAQYQIAAKSSCPDLRLVRMCQGIWSKLKYERSRYRAQRKRIC